MIEILPYSSIFFNFHLHDEHDFGSFPIYVGFAEAIWTCDGKWVGSNIRNSSLNEYAGKKGILSPQKFYAHYYRGSPDFHDCVHIKNSVFCLRI